MASKRGFHIGASSDDTYLIRALLVKVVWMLGARGCFSYYMSGCRPLISFTFLQYFAHHLSCFISLVIHGIHIVYWSLGFRAFL